MNFERFKPKIFTYTAIFGVITTAVLSAEATPKALQLMEEAGAVTFKQKFNASWKCYILPAASGVITIWSIISLSSQNAKLALAYSVGQTALKLYSERATPQVRQEIATVSTQANIQTESIILDPLSASEDTIVPWKFYISDQEFRASKRQVKNSLRAFNEGTLQKEGEGSMNQLFGYFQYTSIESNDETYDRLGWKYTPEFPEAIPLIYPGFNRDGLPCAILDFVNPPQWGYDNKFA